MVSRYYLYDQLSPKSSLTRVTETFGSKQFHEEQPSHGSVEGNNLSLLEHFPPFDHGFTALSLSWWNSDLEKFSIAEEAISLGTKNLGRERGKENGDQIPK